jgi:hypothetical protein
MSRLCISIGCLLAATTVATAADMAAGTAAQPAPAQPPAWALSMASEVRYYAWQSNRGSPTGIAPLAGGGSGAELYVPYAVELVGKPSDDFKVELIGRGGYVWARQSTAGLTGEVSTTTDTVAAATVTYLGLAGLQPFVAVSTNIATGKSALFGTAANARMDPDLVELASFGEGTNIGPTVGFNLPLTGSLIATFSTGYTWRGRFQRENLLVEQSPFGQAQTTIDPGDDLTVTGSLNYASGQFSGSLTGSISRETTTFQDGAPLFRAGTRYLLAGSLSYAWPETWGVTTLTAAGAHADANEVKFLNRSALVAEPNDTNSNVYRVGIQHLLAVGQFAVGPTASYLIRDRNGYDATTLQFVPQKQRTAVGLLAQFPAGQQVTFNARVDHVWTHEDDNPVLGGQKFSVLANAFLPGSAVPVVSSTAWQAAVGVNVKF